MKANQMNKKWTWGLAVVLVVAGYFAYRVAQADVELEVVRPRMGTICAYVEEQAITELPRDFLVAMPIDGWLEPIELREGDEVHQGAVVARLDTDDLEDRVRQARQRIANLETKIKETLDHRLEENALEETEATVVAIHQTVEAAEAKLAASKAVAEFAAEEVERLTALREVDAAADRETRQAIATMRKAQAEYQSDALELAALETLAAVSYIGPKFIRDYIDRKSFTKESYEKQLEEAKAALAIEQRNLLRAEIKSPIDGVVLERHQTRRQFLRAGTKLLTVGQLEDLEIIAEVLTERATRISPGDPVDIFGGAIQEETSDPITGAVFRVYPAGFTKISSLGVEQQRVNVAIELDRQPERLGVGFRAYVRIYHDEVADALIVPRVALFRGDKSQWQVMVVRDGLTRLQPVTVGLTNDDEAQITAGLEPDDAVVAQPSREIVEGMRVRARTIE